MDTVSAIAVKVAVTFLGPFMVTLVGLIDPVRSTDQPLKLYPAFAAAETDTLCPLLYQLVPDGVTVPPADGLAVVVKLYWVVKLAV